MFDDDESNGNSYNWANQGGSLCLGYDPHEPWFFRTDDTRHPAVR